jgi:aspartate ammonia-lyase
MAKALEFDDVIKVGRTQLMDAVPMRLGSEFRAFAVTVGEDIDRLREFANLLREVNLGGTAIGTGINTPEGYSDLVIRHLAASVGRPLVPAADLIEATSDLGAFVTFSGVLKRIAVKLSKICNDLRLLNSAVRARGFGEIRLPAVQAGSSIMPGKVNPVIPEVVNQIAYQVIGNDLTVTMAAEAGQLQLNAMEPVIVLNILQSMRMLMRGMTEPAREMHHRHRGGPRALPRTAGGLAGHRHRAQSLYRLCRGQPRGQAGAQNPPLHPRRGPGRGPDDRGTARRGIFTCQIAGALNQQ